MSSFANQFIAESVAILGALNTAEVDSVTRHLCELRSAGGRLFILGVGGSAAHASHAVNDFRKIAAIEAYTPTDNVSELTARTNDDGWQSTFLEWLKVSKLRREDALLIFSVGGGNKEKNVSTNLIAAIDHAKSVGAKVLGIVGKDGGYTRAAASACVVIPNKFPERVTPHTEGLCAVIWHLIVSHPEIQKNKTKW